MDFSIPVAGMQSASAAFDSAAASITQAFNRTGPNGPSNASSPGDSVDLSTQVAGLLKSRLDFAASVQVALVDNATTQSTLSVLG